MPLGAIMPWKRAKLDRAMAPLWGVLALAIAAGALVWTFQTGRTILAPIGTLLAVWLTAGAAADLWQRAGRGDFGSKLRRLRNLPGADWGKAVAHTGFGITIFGVSALLAWELEDIRVAQIGDTFEVGSYEITLSDVRDVRGPNYLSTMAEIEVTQNGRDVATLFPEKRIYPVAGMPTTEAAIDNGITRDVYVVIGDPQDDGGWAVRTYIKPFANWIWAGSIVMALGGILSLTDRRYRVAAGARRTRASASSVPAE
jgi:cytochrome c-type biogenesis protein CcmF